VIRPLVRGVIVDEDRVLLTLSRFDDEVYLLPGGEPRAGESSSTALSRHVQEQTGYEVAAHELLWIREHTRSNHLLLLDPPGSYVVELIYRCTLSGAAVTVAAGGGPQQVAVEWVPGDRLPRVEFLPKSLVEPLAAYLADRSVIPPVYVVEGA
jgi:ADP-ribose pyrophosphatase YjhB (NUDIX family)